jgi:hypothetical protein
MNDKDYRRIARRYVLALLDSALDLQDDCDWREANREIETEEDLDYVKSEVDRLRMRLRSGAPFHRATPGAKTIELSEAEWQAVANVLDSALTGAKRYAEVPAELIALGAQGDPETVSARMREHADLLEGIRKAIFGA